MQLRILFIVFTLYTSFSFANNYGWIHSRECIAGLNSLDSLKTDSQVWRWKSSDTLLVHKNLGSLSRLKIYRNQQLLLREQDFQITQGDSILVFANQFQASDSLCLDEFTTPLLMNPTFSLYQLSDIPIFKDSLLGSSLNSNPISQPFLSNEDTSYSKYRLNYSGSKSMAVTMGSGGGLGLDASLFINLNGQVAEDVFVEGQLSDQNVPIQPDGNTTTLKEVDTKFVRVHGKHYAYTLGNYLLDYGVPNEDRYTAKVQGVNGFYSRGDYSLQGTWSISDGQYQSDTLRGVDGKQRGYYLRGKGGRQFITVLAGTERVWRNGVPLQRGVDYTIDYSEGRLDFLSAVQVTSENLYSAEYQYTEQDFQRTLTSGELRDTAGVFTWSLRAISELENKNQPLNRVLDSTNLTRFSNAGDSILLDSLGHVIRMPQSQSIAVADLALNVPTYSGKAALLFSQLDKNLYSNKEDGKNLGYSSRYLGRHTLGHTLDKGGWGQSDFVFDHEYRATDFESFKQLIEPRGFLETWNLDSRIAQKGFLADRVTLEERPYTKLILKGEIGLANADAVVDSLSIHATDGSESRRGGLSGHIGGDKTFVELSSEAKLAKSPDRRDNYRQAGKMVWSASGYTPSVAVTRNEWQTVLQNGLVAQSVKEEPEFLISTEPFFGKVSLATGFNLLSQRTNFSGVISGLQDSVKDLGITQKVVATGMGPWNSDLFYGFHHHQLWRLDAFSQYANTPEQNNFNQVEWNNHIANRKQGYNFVSTYRISQTAEQPLVDDFRLVPGKGNYTYDSLLRAYHQVEVGGDYVLIGLKRDTTLGTRPYQDLSFSSNLNLVPAKFPIAVTGVLADIELSFDMTLDHQDTTGKLGLVPLLGDAQIEQARSGRSRYNPGVHWKSPDAKKTANINVDRSFTLAAGIYAYKEKLWNEGSDYRHDLNEFLEYTLEQSFENRIRDGRTATSTSLPSSSTPTSASENENYAYGARLLRRLPKSFSLEGRGQYLTVTGNSSSGTTELQGVKPGLKLEKTSLYNGRVFLDYGLIYFWGFGDGSYYTTGEYVRGLTHRIEANANFQVGQNMYLNFDYVIRVEPNGNSLNQKLTAEARAVF